MPPEVIATLNDVPVGSAIAVEVDGVPIALVRGAPDAVTAIYHVCSHQYFALAPEGWVDDNSIECTLHGSVFNLDTGAPTTLPALDPIPVYACELADGDILVDVSQQRNAAQPPRH